MRDKDETKDRLIQELEALRRKIAQLEKEQEFTSTLEELPASICNVDIKGNIINVSKRFLKVTGYSVEEVVGKNAFELGIFSGKSLKLLVQRLKDRLSGKPGTSLEVQFKCKDGRLIWVEIIGRLLLKHNIPTGIQIIAQDITERKRAEEMLRESEAKYRAVIEAAVDQIFLINSEMKILSMNNYAAGFSHKKQEDMVGKSLTEIFPSQIVADMSKNIQGIFETGINTTKEEILVFGDKSMWVSTVLSPMKDDNGEVIAVIGIARDITERKRAEDVLKKSEEKYRRIVETALEGVMQTDVDTRIIFINPRIEEMLGYPAEEIIGQTIAKFKFEEDLAEHIKRIKERRKGISERFETRFRRKDGSPIWVFVSATVVKDEKGQFAGTFSLMTDITDRKRLEEERQKVQKLESVGLLAGGIAHDFNNILTAIVGNISLAKMETNPGSELHDRLGEAEKASLRAKSLTQQLLTFSKGGAPVKKLASLEELLRDTASFALRGSSVRCEFSLPENLWHAEIDEGQISQVINNLVINARQAMPSGGTIEVRAEKITLTGEQSLGRRLPLKEGNYIRIAVIDHGTGIPAEYLEKIFDPFFTTKQKGSGLGLATSFSIVHNHGGHLGVESKVGAGSTFYVYLPASSETAITVKSEEKMTDKPIKTRILVMDDEETVREVASRMLKHIGYEDVEVAPDGAEAIKLYKEAMKASKPFDVVILDLTIPGGMGGKEAIKKLLEINPQVKAIVSSGYSSDSAITEYKEHGFSGMVAKPYTIDQLRTVLNEVMSYT